MLVSAWSNGSGSYGLRIGMPNRREHFRQEWDHVVLELDGESHDIGITPSFWRSCPEIRSPVIRAWLECHHTLEWRKGHPPQVRLVPQGGNQFKLVP